MLILTSKIGMFPHKMWLWTKIWTFNQQEQGLNQPKLRLKHQDNMTSGYVEQLGTSTIQPKHNVVYPSQKTHSHIQNILQKVIFDCHNILPLAREICCIRCQVHTNSIPEFINTHREKTVCTTLGWSFPRIRISMCDPPLLNDTLFRNPIFLGWESDLVLMFPTSWFWFWLIQSAANHAARGRC